MSGGSVTWCRQFGQQDSACVEKMAFTLYMKYASMLVEIEQDAETGAFKRDFTLHNQFTEIFRN